MRNLLTALGILFFGFFLSIVIGLSKPAADKITEGAPPSQQVNVIRVTPQKHPIQIKSHGFIEASHKIDLIAEVSGEVLSISPKFIKGGAFQADEKILSINDINYEAALLKAKAELAMAEEALASETARAEQAKKEWRDLGSEAANHLFLRKPQLSRASTDVESARLYVAKATQELHKTTPSLSFNARIIDSYVNVNQYLTVGTKIASVYAENRLQVSLNLSQHQLNILGIEWPITPNNNAISSIRLNSTLGRHHYQWQGEIQYSSAIIDTNNQLASVIVNFIGDTDHAIPGLYTEAVISSDVRDDVIIVPENAFHDKRYILTVSNDNKINIKPAKYLTRDADQVYLSADIPGGSLIITDRIPLAVEGMSVTPIIAKASTEPNS